MNVWPVWFTTSRNPAVNTEVSTKDITKGNSDARLSKLTNAGRLRQTRDAHLRLPNIPRQTQVRNLRSGEAVVEALPDRAKVEDAHSKFRFGKKTRKKSKK